VNLNPMPNRSVNEVRDLVEAELSRVGNAGEVRGIDAFLLDPRMEMRFWDWGETPREYPVWVVAESSRYDYGIVFSDYGFAPDRPWGLVFLSRRNFDADYCWYSTLPDAYRDSRLLEEHEEAKTDSQIEDVI
jgi:hypothetical protein